MKKIVLIGPESTGKSTLCTDLAAHYKTSWVPEYAREYLLKNGMNYTYEDLLHIARMQVKMEDEYAATERSDILFIDTDMYVMKVWCEFVFGKCHQWILDQIAVRKYDLYLLCSTDLPWVKDELREYPDLESRQQLFHMYKDLMVNQQAPWKEITGASSDRLASAIAAVVNSLD
jgi:NadR type nicotinamide-nucleotide adenylyltransferase